MIFILHPRYIACQLCDCNLQQYVKASQMSSIPKDLEVGVQIANGLAYMHRNGFVHKDIKPANILLKDGIIKITDMGISKKLIPGQSRVSKTTACGTPDWIAPEYSNYDSESYDFACPGDIWALGCVLHYLFTRGGHPFGLGSPGLENAEKGLYSNLGELKDRLGPEYGFITQLIIRMVCLDTNQRPSMDVVLSTVKNQHASP